MSGGTDNHLLLVDVFSRGLTGKVSEAALGRASITVNKNAIPFDENPPMVASGIRLGTPAVTTRGMNEPEMDKIGEFISRVLDATRGRYGRIHGPSRGRGTEPQVPAVPGPVSYRTGSSPGSYVTNSEGRTLGAQVAEALADDGPLARTLPSFEPRPGQREMAAAAGDIFDGGGVLLAEAGTGTGKTLALLGSPPS